MRKFECPFCNFTKIFYGEEARKSRKRVSGFTCPSCGKKVTDDDIRRIKGKGPKPKKERRKRSKKKEVKETSKVVVHPNIEQFEWRTKDQFHLPPSEATHPGARAGGRRNYHPKPLQPTERSLEEAILMGSNIKPSAPLPKPNPGNHETKNPEPLKPTIDNLERQAKKIAALIVTFSTLERKLNEEVNRMSEKISDFDKRIQTVSTLLHYMETSIKDRAIKDRARKDRAR